MNTIWNKKIPTLVAILLLVIGVGATTILVQNTTNFFGHAAPPETPEDIRITNVTDTTFTLTYKTEAQVIGTLNLEGEGNPQQVLDDRDQASGTPQVYSLHSITVKNLKPSTAYTFSILSGSTPFTNNGKSFAVTTGPVLSTPPSEQVPLSGRILSTDGTKPTEALVYVTTAKGQTLSTLMKPSGLYILPLNTLRSDDFSQYMTLTQDTPLQILIKSPTDQSQALILPTAINPVPAITLSQDYDFTINTSPLATSEATKLHFPSFAFDTSIQATPHITVPKSDESFSDQQPQFTGTALPNQQVTVTVHSTEQTATVQADSSGKWSYRPSTPLTPGKHTLTITTTDTLGILHTIQQSFTVYAAGSQVDQTATPSGNLATPTPTQKPTATPTHSASSGPTATPILKPTATPTIPPTVSGQTKGGLSFSPTPRPTLPPTGANTVVITAATGIITTIVGIALFILTRGAAL